MDCGITNLETGNPKLDSAGSGGPFGMLKMDSWQVLAGLSSSIGLSELSKLGVQCIIINDVE